MKKEKHGFNTWENYLAVHEKVLNSYKHYFKNQNVRYQVQKFTENYYSLKIPKLELITLKSSRVIVKIIKDVEVKEGVRKKIAKTFFYSYHVRYAQSDENILRYCGPDEHRPYHHKHVYKNDVEFKVEKVRDNEWPHVNEFLDEIINHY